MLFKQIPSIVRLLSTQCLVKMESVKRFKESGEKVIGTHDGVFHCDEVLACFMLKQLPQYQQANIIRSRNQSLLDECDIVVDVGAIFDRKVHRYDHHQATFCDTFNTLRPDLKSKWDLKLSSAGLVYTYFGEDVIKTVLKSRKSLDVTDNDLKKLFIKIYDNFISEIDAIDNGIPMFESEPRYNINTHLSARVGRFNQAWNAEEFDERGQFDKAMAYVGEELLDKIFYYSEAWLPARSIVDKAIKNRFNVHSSGEILDLEHFCPWKEHLYELEKEYQIEGIPKYVLYDGTKPNDYRVICVPLQPASFVCRKFLHKKWRGKRDEDMEKISGIAGTVFCHATGFIGGNKTKEGALEMAVASLNSDETE